MKIHSDTLTSAEVFAAARIARADVVDFDRTGSRTRDYAFDVHLEGESRRRPNRRGNYTGYAATWDQWGVFLGVLYSIDPYMVCGPSEKYAYYRNEDDFHAKTGARFAGCESDHDATSEAYWWPTDAHGDHTFRWNGSVSHCTKCSARQTRI